MAIIGTQQAAIQSHAFQPPFFSLHELCCITDALVWGFVCQAITPPDFFRFK